MTRCILNKEKENNNDEASVSDGHLAWRKVLLQLHTGAGGHPYAEVNGP